MGEVVKTGFAKMAVRGFITDGQAIRNHPSPVKELAGRSVPRGEVKRAIEDEFWLLDYYELGADKHPQQGWAGSTLLLLA